MTNGLRAALALAALSGLAIYGSRSRTASANDDAGSKKGTPVNTPSEVGSALAQSPDSSDESIGSAELERKLDQLEKSIQGAP